MLTDTNTNTEPAIIYWAVIRNQTERHGYVELAHQSGSKWLAVVDDHEYKFRCDTTDFPSVMYAALSQLPAD